MYKVWHYAVSALMQQKSELLHISLQQAKTQPLRKGTWHCVLLEQQWQLDIAQTTSENISKLSLLKAKPFTIFHRDGIIQSINRQLEWS